MLVQMINAGNKVVTRGWWTSKKTLLLRLKQALRNNASNLKISKQSFGAKAGLCERDNLYKGKSLYEEARLCEWYIIVYIDLCVSN